MSELKILKATCNKTNIHFGLEIKQFGSTWKVVNMVRLSEEEYKTIASEVSQPTFVTNDNLLACRRCGNRRIGGCNCSRMLHACSSNMKYQFDCVYCSSFVIDFTRPQACSPYTEWAGISNIPGAIKDHYGNPQGTQYDLAKDGSFQDYTIIVLNLCSECNFGQPKAALQKKGFRIEEYITAPPVEVLKNQLAGTKTQLWVISDRVARLTSNHIAIISKCFHEGHGLYIWGTMTHITLTPITSCSRFLIQKCLAIPVEIVWWEYSNMSGSQESLRIIQYRLAFKAFMKESQ